MLELLTDYDANGSFADMARNVNTTDGTGYAWYVRMTDLENPKPLSELKYVDETSYKFPVFRVSHHNFSEIVF